ncbi:MAG: hypothetical protein ACLSA1_07470, partial [Alphaproteobacteria bacterium]
MKNLNYSLVFGNTKAKLYPYYFKTIGLDEMEEKSIGSYYILTLYIIYANLRTGFELVIEVYHE